MSVRVRQVCILLLVTVVSGLLSGGAAGAAFTTSAVVTALIDAVPERYRGGGPMFAAAAAPSVVEPATAVPAPAAPRTTVPRPAVGTPSAEEPDAEEPDAEKPDGDDPEVDEPEVDEPEVEDVEEPAQPRSVPGTPCRSTARACIELSDDQAWLIRDGEVSYGPVPITHGRKGFRTPPGTFEVSFRNRDHVSSIYDSPMPYSVFFNGGIAFHQGSLQERSHGCIHLSRSAAREFFDSLRPGDVVQVVR